MRAFVTERVTCGECGANYDSAQTPFCPRCGGTRAATSGAVAGAKYAASGEAAGTSDGRRGLTGAGPGLMSKAIQDPRQTRTRRGGIMLASIAAVFLVIFGGALVMALTVFAEPATVDYLPGYEGLMAGPGGDLELTFTDGGAPLAGARVEATAGNGSLVASGVTDANGTWDVREVAEAMVQVHVYAPSGIANESAGDGPPGSKEAVWAGRFVSFPLSTLHTTIDVAEPSQAETITFAEMPGAFTGYLGFLVAFAALMLAGGIAAIRLRWKGLAQAGAVAGVIPGLLFLVATPSIISVLVAGLLGYAAWAIVQGRDVFA